MKYYMGLDLGQASDYTALTVLEKRAQYTDEMKPAPALYHSRALERFPLGVPYPEMIEVVRERLQSPVLRGNTTLVVDATGVGRPVVDLLRRARLNPVPVTITSGTKATHQDGYWHVPKRDLVGALQVTLQAKRLQFADTMPLVPQLVKEMQDFKVKITAAANDTYGAWREGQHDDLVLAVALAVWYAERRGVVKVYQG